MTASNPFSMMEEMFERMSRQFDDLSRSWESGEGIEMWRPGSHQLALDVADREEEFAITVDVPGFDREDIDVRVNDRTVTVTAESSETETAEETAEDEQYLRRERRHRSLTRTVQLPEEVHADDAHATVQHGVLTITVPKAEPAPADDSLEIEIE
jgi:HSP20 family protein